VHGQAHHAMIYAAARRRVLVQVGAVVLAHQRPDPDRWDWLPRGLARPPSPPAVSLHPDLAPSSRPPDSRSVAPRPPPPSSRTGCAGVGRDSSRSGDAPRPEWGEGRWAIDREEHVDALLAMAGSRGVRGRGELR
jgi:hypothetical protein